MTIVKKCPQYLLFGNASVRKINHGDGDYAEVHGEFYVRLHVLCVFVVKKT